MYRINVRGNAGRKCAFCKYWKDPENLAISPREPEIGLWECDGNMKNECEKRNTIKMATDFCLKFETKL